MRINLIRKPPWLKVWSAITAIALTVALVLTFLPYEASIDTSGILSISLGQKVSAQEPVSTNGMAYAQINKSGCVVREGNCQIRLDFYLEPEDVRYHDTYIETVDTTSPEYLAGYPGKVDEFGNPVDQADYGKWYDSLPKEWVNTPFHSHFIYLPADFTDDDIKTQIDIHLGNFYQAFQDRWDEVPGGMRHGWATETRIRPTDYSKVESAAEYDARVADCQLAIDSLTEFSYKPEGEIQGKTFPATEIDVGNNGNGANIYSSDGYTILTLDNPANDTGTIDYVRFRGSYTGTGLKIGTFSGSGSSWNDRDYHTCGSYVVNENTWTGLDIDVVTGDIIGCCWVTGGGRINTSGGVAVGYDYGDNFGGGAHTYNTATYSGHWFSLYGTGETAGPVAPTVTTQAGSAIHCTNFTANGTIADTGGENCHTRGFCYMVGSSGDPTTANSTVYDNGAGSYGTGAYSKVISSLTCGTSYRVRAYAINSAGTGYGTSVTVTTGEPGISEDPDEYDFGIVAVAGTAVTGLDYFTITNTGNCAVDITIQGTDATNTTGGTLYEYYDTGYDNAIAFYGTVWKAQTFTTTSGAHSIGSVSSKLYRVGSPETITVSIKAVDGSSHPTGGDLCSGTTNGDTLTTDSGGEWRTITFDSTYSLSASTMYAIVVRATGGDLSNYAYWLRDTTSPTYTGGVAEYSNDNGSTWGTTSTADYMFKEYSVVIWDLADDGSPGENIYALKAGLDGGDYTIIVRETATYNTLKSNLAEDATQDWGLKIWIPTALSGYSNQKMTATITLVASEHT